MLRIEFEYKDKYSHGNWSKQVCECSSLQECIEWYGLGVDCEYRIISIKKIGG